MTMPRRKKEQIVWEWMQTHRACRIGEESFERIKAILREESSEALRPPRPRGKPRATDDPEEIISDYFMNGYADYSQLPDIFDTLGERAKDLARLAVCLMEIGFFRSENDKKKRFKVSSKAVYNLICKYKYFQRKPVSYQSFMNALKAIEEEETSYPEKERGKDKIFFG